MPAIDCAHLSRYTLGDRQLEQEVLRLFADQAPVTLMKLREAACAKSWHDAAHTLKGSARAVGAIRVAGAAQDAQAAGHDHSNRDAFIRRIERSIEEALDHISGLASAT
ncbi:MAG: Hpt domain-containing protein [Hyphomicrobiaceae bacterium]